MTVTGADMRTAQAITGATFALFLVVGFIPALRPYAVRLRLAILVVYLVLVVAFMTRLLAW